MVAEVQPAPDHAMAPLAPGPLIRLSRGDLQLQFAPEAGGRIAQIWWKDVGQLVGHAESNASMIGWGCYPMVPWAGRIRRGRFEFAGHHHQLPLNMGAHAIHGLGFAMPWRVERHDRHRLELSLALPQDERWPFGGSAFQRIEVEENHLRLELSVKAGAVAMPATIGWHPWFRKPEHVRFSPTAVYPRDSHGIATLPIKAPSVGPWDDCFVNTEPVVLERASQALALSSDCTHWVVYDENPGATCIEPQSGPTDAFNIEPLVLAPGETLARWFHMAWDVR